MRKIFIPSLFVFVVTLFCVFYLKSILFASSGLGVLDWDQNLAWNEFNRQSILKFGQIPWWNPYRCGGVPHIADPQVGFFSIQTLFVVLLGTINGLKFSIVFHLVLGFFGFYLLARQKKLSSLASTFSSIIFVFGGVTASYLWPGMVVFLNYYYIPFVLLFLEKENSGVPDIVISATIFALSYYYDYHIPLLFVPYIIFSGLINLLFNRNLSVFIKRTCLFFAVFVLISLPKLLLSLELFSKYQRIVETPYGYTIPKLFFYLTSGNQPLFDTLINTPTGADEKSLFVGVVPLIFFLLFLWRLIKRSKREWSIFLQFAANTSLAMAGSVIFSTFYLLRTIPFYKAMNMAERFRFAFFIPLALILGMGLDVFLSKFKDKFKLPVGTFFVLFTFISLTLFAEDNFLNKAMLIENKNVGYKTNSDFFQVNSQLDSSKTYTLVGDDTTFGPSSFEFEYLSHGVGVVDCYSPFGGTRSVKGANETGYKGEWYLDKAKDGLKIVSFSPLKMQFAIDEGSIKESDLLVINQNYFEGWHAEVDGKIVKASPYNELISVPVTNKTKMVTLIYRPYSFK